MSVLTRRIRTLHLLLAMLVGLHFVLIATTGGMFVFAGELTDLARFLRGWQSTSGDVGPDLCYERIAATVPEWDGSWLGFPNDETPFYTAYTPLGSDFFWNEVFVDPGTGKVVGTVRNDSFCIEGVLQIAIQLHIRLCAGEWGRRLVDVSVTLLLVELLTGLWLWWPGWRRWRQAFQIPRTTKRFLLLYDWHRLLGATAAPFLLLMTLTGLLWAFPSVMRPVFYALCGERAPADQRGEHVLPMGEEAHAKASVGMMSFADAVKLARPQHPGAAVTGIDFGQDHRQLVTVYLEPDDGGEAVEVQVDRQLRRVLPSSIERRAPTTGDRLTNAWAHSLHYGTFGGVVTKVLYLFACCAVDALYVTGMLMWWQKRQKQKRRLSIPAGDAITVTG